MKLSEHLRAICDSEYKGKQKPLAKDLHISEATLSRMLKGKHDDHPVTKAMQLIKIRGRF